MYISQETIVHTHTNTHSRTYLETTGKLGMQISPQYMSLNWERKPEYPTNNNKQTLKVQEEHALHKPKAKGIETLTLQV